SCLYSSGKSWSNSRGPPGATRLPPAPPTTPSRVRVPASFAISSRSAPSTAFSMSPRGDSADTTASAPSKTSPSPARSSTEPCTYSTPSIGVPGALREITVTRCPRPAASRAICVPAYPVPPMTTMRATRSPSDIRFHPFNTSRSELGLFRPFLGQTVGHIGLLGHQLDSRTVRDRAQQRCEVLRGVPRPHLLCDDLSRRGRDRHGNAQQLRGIQTEIEVLLQQRHRE